jgi:hypothetical protein
MMNNNILEKAIKKLKFNLHDFTAPMLAKFFVIYSSEVTSSSVLNDQNFDDKLEFIMSRYIDTFNPEEFSMLCNAIVHKHHEAEGSNYFSNFLY